MWWFVILLLGTGSCSGVNRSLSNSVNAKRTIESKAWFQEIGQIAIPVVYEDVILTVPWDNYITAFTDLLGEVEDEVKAWRDRALSITDSEAKKKAEKRVAMMDGIFREKKTQARNSFNQSLSTVGRSMNPNPGPGGKRKRDFWSVLMNAINFGVGVSNRASIGDLKNREAAIHHEQVVSRKLLREVRLQVHNEANSNYQQWEDQLIQEKISTSFEAMERFVIQFNEAVYEALRGKLSPLLVTPEMVEKCQQKVDNHTRNNGLRMATGRSLLSVPISILVAEEGASITFHVPLVDKHELIGKLYHMKPVQFIDERRGTTGRSSEEFFGCGTRRCDPIRCK